LLGGITFSCYHSRRGWALPFMPGLFSYTSQVHHAWACKSSRLTACLLHLFLLLNSILRIRGRLGRADNGHRRRSWCLFGRSWRISMIWLGQWAWIAFFLAFAATTCMPQRTRETLALSARRGMVVADGTAVVGGTMNVSISQHQNAASACIVNIRVRDRRLRGCSVSTLKSVYLLASSLEGGAVPAVRAPTFHLSALHSVLFHITGLAIAATVQYLRSASAARDTTLALFHFAAYFATIFFTRICCRSALLPLPSLFSTTGFVNRHGAATFRCLFIARCVLRGSGI